MKNRLVLLALTCLAVSLSSCAYPTDGPCVQWVSTGRILASQPGVIGPLYTINGVAMQQYSPSLYTPFLYDHRGLAHNTYHMERALRAEKRATVQVGPMRLVSEDPAPPYEVRRAVAVRR